MLSSAMRITTERLALRDFEAEDWQAVLAYQRDPRYLRYYPLEDRSEEEVRDFIAMFLRQQAEVPRRKFQLAVTLRENGRLIGNCGVRLEEPGASSGDMGYELDPRYWGHGYATEAAGAMLDFAFSELGIERVEAWCIAENLASARVLEKLGMRLKERERDKEHFKGRSWDALRYALEASDWQERAKRRTKLPAEGG
jgi:ribosomal-protein-alanine N-acetyltransferase